MNPSSSKTRYMEIWRKHPLSDDKDSLFKGVSLVAFSPGPCSRYVAFAGERGLLLLSADGGRLLAKLSDQLQRTSIKAFSWFLPDTLVCAYSNGNIVDIRVTQERLDVDIAICEGHCVECLTVDQKGEYLATAARQAISTWHRQGDGSWTEHMALGSSLPMRAVDQKLPVIVTSLSWYEDPGQLLIVSYRFHGIHIWDVRSATVLRTVLDPGGVLGNASLSPDQRYLAVVTEGGVDVIRIQDKALGKKPVYADCGVDYPVVFLHDGRAVLTSTVDGNVQLTTRDGSHLQTLRHRDICAPSGDTVLASAAASRSKLNLYFANSSMKDSNVLSVSEGSKEINPKLRICTVSRHCICMWETADPSSRDFGSLIDMDGEDLLAKDRRETLRLQIALEGHLQTLKEASMGA
ncbi:hypothetical protein NM688_g7961 [Phlebia brevispora]|uniref:Uncharacterized protein n=1 Tax=Phlebia brevispora TaxID=194682 RepID=A0ACC1RZ51_9APHY|nr:hypothetical protein NM688_g7961 [Phlebia brevispora]